MPRLFVDLSPAAHEQLLQMSRRTNVQAPETARQLLESRLLGEKRAEQIELAARRIATASAR